MSQFKTTFLVPHCSGKSSFHMSEELAFQCTFGQSPTVNGNEGSPTSPALVVNGGGHQFFSRPSFSRNVNGIIVRSQLPYLLEDPAHLMVLANDPRKAAEFTQLNLQTQQICDVSKGSKDAHESSGLICHAGHRHLNPARIPVLGDNIEGILHMGPGPRRLSAKGTAAAAKWLTECLVAILS